MKSLQQQQPRCHFCESLNDPWPNIQLCRFKTPLNTNDVRFDEHDMEFVLLPTQEELVSTSNRVTGVSFFFPIHKMLTSACAFISRRLGGVMLATATPTLPFGLGSSDERCFNTSTDDSFPTGLCRQVQKCDLYAKLFIRFLRTRPLMRITLCSCTITSPKLLTCHTSSLHLGETVLAL